MKKSRQQLGVLLLWVWILFFCEIFFLPLWKKIRRSLVAVSSNKNVTLDKLWFFSVHWNYFVFSKSHHFLYFFIREHFSARKCSLCQTMACTDRKSHKQRLLLLWDNKLQKKDRDAFPTFCFSNQQTFGNVKKGLLSKSLLLTKVSNESSRCLSPVLFNESFASMTKRKWKFCKISDRSFLKLFLWTRKMKIWHPC